ncbi:hypothetical protein L0P22_02695 [Anaerobutyricum soehngenii]|uniref:hypothetical protein n=1 Tax=Anaerobutyricum soehngenii TaxID=105843 RepID=UPI001EDAC1E9|nr:hypothetical protein [Anaerobutyricum soehngenii]MCG4697183.1 hypothetical protein [Anaerobutyricum soehngenii]
MVYDGGISSVLNNKLTYKFKVGKYLDKKYICAGWGIYSFCIISSAVRFGFKEYFKRKWCVSEGFV